MAPVHATSLTDREPLAQIVLKELKNVGLHPKLETPKPPKRSQVPFSTPGATTPGPPTGRIFGKRLTDLSKLLVSLDPHTDILVPKFVVSACSFIQENLNTEGIFRLAGSNARQKNIRRELEASERDLGEITPPPSVVDVASLLKQFLRELPLPLLPSNIHSLLVDASSKGESSLLLSLLLLSTEHLSCLSYLCRHLAAVAANHAVNKMTTRNLAIVLTPSFFPIQDSYNNGPGKDRKFADGDKKLKIQTNIVETLINNASQIGYLTGVVYDKYFSLVSQPGYTSEECLEDDYGPGGRKKGKKRIRRRSGSLSRVLSVMGKGIRAIARTTTPSKTTESVHSTPLPPVGSPDYPSPRLNSKRKASADHELSPSSKSARRGFESTFTPKMRSRTFSVKRFKRKKSEGKLQQKETFVLHTSLVTPQHRAEPASPYVHRAPAPSSARREPAPLPTTSVDGATGLYKTNSTEWDSTLDEQPDQLQYDQPNQSQYDQMESEYAEVKAHYQDLKEEVRRLEEDSVSLELDPGSETASNSSQLLHAVEERYTATREHGTLGQEPMETTKQIARVKRRSSEGKKPRSPSERRIGVIRRRSREREERLGRTSPGPADRGPSPRERGRSPGPRRNINRSPVTKPALTPHLDESFKSKLLRGRPNSTSSGLEKPSPVQIPMVGPHGNIRIKNSFKLKDRPAALKAMVPILTEPTSPRSKPSPVRGTRQSPRKLSHSDSITSLRNDIHDLIENSFSSTKTLSQSSDVEQETVDGWRDSRTVSELSSKLANVSLPNTEPADFMAQESPLTRAQLRRQSHSFEFAKPVTVDSVAARTKHDALRRQSSAFEFCSAKIEPIYENLSRDVASRASLRRRNSSVKDLIQRMEAEAKKRVEREARRRVEGEAKRRVGSSSSSSSRTLGSTDEESGEEKPEKSVLVPTLRIDEQERSRDAVFSTDSEPARDQEETDFLLAVKGACTPTRDPADEVWMDGTEFFKTVEAAALPQCGRSSIVKIRKENRGRVLDSVHKFSGAPGATPVRRGPVAGTRRLSARMGCASPILPAPPATRRQTLTGIKTSAASSRSHYTAQTLSTLNKMRDKSPIPPPPQSTKSLTLRKSPMNRALTVDSIQRRKKSSPQQPAKTLSTRSKERNPTTGVRRSASNSAPRKRSEAGRGRRREERRYLTIGFPEEARSPLKECLNIHANIKRSNSDQTPTSKKPVKKSGLVPPGPENLVLTADQTLPRPSYQNVLVARTHSLKSDVIMSPGHHTPRTERVRRAMSDRSTPRTTPYVNVYSSHKAGRSELVRAEETPRRSPRLHSLM